MEYLDFDVRIRAEGDRYSASVGGPAGEGTHDFDWPFTTAELDEFLGVIGRPRSRASRKQAADVGPPPATLGEERRFATEFGRRLGDAVFDGEVAERLAASHHHAVTEIDRGLRIRLQLSEVPELQAAPWEFLWKDELHGFPVLSRETPIVRYLDRGGGTLQSLQVEPPFRVLLMVSNPSSSSLPTLDVGREQEQLRAAISELPHDVEIDVLGDATLESLQDALRRTSYHVFHYIGHSGYDPVEGVGTLALETNDGRLRPARGDQLMLLLKDHPSLRLAVLNSCDGARRFGDDPFAGVAHALMWGGLPAVIAMQFEISDDAAVMFSQELYEALATGDPLEEALAEARKRIYNSGLIGTEWGTPVLFMRVPDGRLFEAPADEQTWTAPPDEPGPTGWRRSVRRFREWLTPGRAIGAFVVGAVGLTASVLGIIDFFDDGNAAPTIDPLEEVTARAGQDAEIDLLTGVRDDGGVNQLTVRPDATSEQGGRVGLLDDGRTVRYTAPDDHVGHDEIAYNVADREGASTPGVQVVDVLQGGIDGSPAVAVPPLAQDGIVGNDLVERVSARIGEQVAASFDRSTFSDTFAMAGPIAIGEPVDDPRVLESEIAADVVIHGTLESDGAVSVVELRFFLSEDELTNATELASDYALATIESDASGSLSLLAEIDRRVPPAVDALASLLEGVRQLNQNRFTEAEEHLSAARASWPRSRESSNGLEVVLMLLGNIELEDGDLDAAKEYYDEALTIAEDATRPRFGLAEIEFLRSRGPQCGGETDYDQDGLDRAAGEFRALVAIREVEPFSAPRAAIEVGRIQLCTYLNTGTGLDDAEATFTAAINRYDGFASLREVRAEAHQRRATAREWGGDIEAAVEDYLTGIDLLIGDDTKEGRWHYELARLYACQLDDSTEAAYHYGESEHLLGEDGLTRHDCGGGT